MISIFGVGKKSDKHFWFMEVNPGTLESRCLMEINIQKALTLSKLCSITNKKRYSCPEKVLTKNWTTLK